MEEDFCGFLVCFLMCLKTSRDITSHQILLKSPTFLIKKIKKEGSESYAWSKTAVTQMPFGVEALSEAVNAPAIVVAPVPVIDTLLL